MKNIIIAEFLHETNCLSTKYADRAAFEKRLLLRGDAVVRHFQGTKSEIGGFLDVFADKEDCRLIPAIALNTSPSGPVTMDMFELGRDTILAKIRELDHVDGILLALHGAMVLTEFDDGEGALLEALRAEVGEALPIITTLDLHANITARMIQHATAFFVYDYNPHVDQYQTGLNAANCMYDTLSGKIKPTMCYRKLPLVLPLMPTGIPPMKRFVDMEHELEERPGVISVNICHGFYASDLVEHGVAVIAVTDNNAAYAQELADTLGEAIWDDRRSMVRTFYSIDDALDEAIELEGSPIVFGDVADNPGAGSTSDGTHILRRMLERGIKNVAIATINDPEAVLLAEKAGIGNTVELDLGGKCYPEILGAPVHVQAYVRMLMDGQYVNRDEMLQGVRNRIGKVAVLTVNDIDVIVSSNLVQPWDAEVFRACGIMPQDKKILVTKSSLHYKNSFGKFAYKIFDVEVPGLAPQDPKAVVAGYNRCPRPMYPLDDM